MHFGGGVDVVRIVRCLLLFLGLAMLSACAVHEQRAEALPQAPVAAPQSAMMTTPDTVITTRTVAVHFDLNSDEIRAGAMQTLYGMALELRGLRLGSIRVTGYTDTSGRRSYNQKLSERRAAAVAAQLSKLGLKAELVTVSGVGETKAAPRHSKNDRRVEVTFELVQEAALFSPVPAPSLSTDYSAGSLPALTLSQTDSMHPLTLPQAFAIPTALAPLRSTAKHAIKRVVVLDGTGWLPPPAA